MTFDIEKELAELVKDMWGLQGRNLLEGEGTGMKVTSELTMEGSPWNISVLFTSSGDKGAKLRLLLMEIIRVMRR